MIKMLLKFIKKSEKDMNCVGDIKRKIRPRKSAKASG